MAGLIQHDIMRMGNQIEQFARSLVAEYVALVTTNQQYRDGKLPGSTLQPDPLEHAFAGVRGQAGVVQKGRIPVPIKTAVILLAQILEQS